MAFAEQLVQAIQQTKNAVLVGIDPRPENLPEGFLSRFDDNRAGVAEALGAFGNEIVEIVAGRVPAVKFQAAFYEAYGPEGVAALDRSARHAKAKGLLVVIDGKRNDIGSTAEAYARAYLGKVPVGSKYEPCWAADALTINPYLGSDGVLPFLKVAAREGRGVFVLLRTSNPSAGEFQDLVADGRPLYQHVAQRLAGWAEPYRYATGYSLCGAVVGATYPKQLEALREALAGVFFLVPGYGSQGGKAKDVASAFDEQGLGALVNNSRGLIFAYERPNLRARFGSNWQGAVEHALQEMIDELRAETRMSRLG